MKTVAKIGWAVLYAVIALSANPSLAGDVSGLLIGPMQKIILTEPAKDLPEIPLVTMQDTAASLADYKGKWVVLNFWATWCPPCRQEMPSLDRLQAARPGIVVLPVATGPNPLPAVTRFWDEAAITNITTLRDPDRALSSALRVLGLPMTVIINPQGQEIARLIGDAEWDAPEVLALLDAFAAP